jgi:hypothetical protein
MLSIKTDWVWGWGLRVEMQSEMQESVKLKPRSLDFQYNAPALNLNKQRKH